MSEKVWAANDDENTYWHDSLGELLDSDNDLEPGYVVYFGHTKPILMESLVTLYAAENVIEGIHEHAFEIGDDTFVDALKFSKDADASLHKAILEWAKANITYDYKIVDDIEKYILTNTDFLYI